MDAKSRANFINSIANGQNVSCPKCNALNEVNAKFCEFCGTPLMRKRENDPVPFTTTAEKTNIGSMEDAEIVTSVKAYKEPESAFAEGLPSWDIEPPLIISRRKKK